ncbi:DEAD/DEAH box helicase [Sphingobium sp. Cam5-1]|uniref:DEAD/DEAH box helicase n=1 Tax=Sphingobium sp. Cam5-1 TaxID=2789327 RepID=UPI0018AD1A56|nr:AAA domain-containing protein [Sphingobium sp. Cam5-1]QPI73342.1 hypothetical protein IZV00_02205 [Sphingobium sp. Cam5-1]
MSEGQAGVRNTLLDYDLGPVLRRADLRVGRPSIRAATRRSNGLPVIVKSWPRREGMDDRELEEVWRNEIRQLHRLVSYPGATDRLAVLQNSAEVEDGFHLLLSNDHRLPLQRWLDDPRGGDWYRSPRTARNRVRLWEEIARVAEGLEILHAQGLLHRNIDTWSVLTSIGDQPDFLLTGFEWSIRLTSAAVGRQRRRTASARSTRYSFYEDWRAVGVLACRLMNFPARGRADEPYFPDVERDAEFLLAAERDLLVLLLTSDPLSRLDATIVLQKISTILEGLRAQLTGGQPRLVLALGLGTESNLSAAIFRASGELVESDEEAEQLLFVRQDLGEEPKLIRFKEGEGDRGARYVLRGSRLTYRLQTFVPPGGGAPSWAVARCYDAEAREPAHARIDRSVVLGTLPIEVITIREAAQGAAKLVGTTTRWDALVGAPPPDPLETALQDKTYGELVLFQVAEMLMEAADIWPVTVAREKTSGGNVTLELTVRRDDVLERLSHALDLPPPGPRLRRLMESDQVGVEGEWRLTEEPVLGLRGGDRTRWRLVNADLKARPERYVLEGPGPSPNGSDLYLRAGGDGSDRLLQRKLKALRSLREHGELLEMLASPRLRRRASHDRWALDGLSDVLDASKMKALGELWAVLPLYLLQGPPGVGKTRLVQELVAARMGQDGAERLLLTAQSHAAVDHLLEKVKGELDKRRDMSLPDPVLALRCRPKDHGSGSSDWDLPVRAAALAADLAQSDLARSAPAHLAQKISDVAATLRGAGMDDGEPLGRQLRNSPDRSFQSLLLRSSNLVFASTNAGELETLVEERAQFDWSIVEEAGKATGVDLLAPLLLSYRRLMIGDHKQLPPFNTERMEKLFAAPQRIADAFDVGRHLLARAFGQAGIDEALDFVANADIETLSAGARSRMMMFETMIEAETAKPPREGRLSMAMQLDQQHRMHPAIGQLVERSFYPGTLATSDDARARFATEPCPVSFAGAVGSSPVTFINMPFGHAMVGGSSPEMPPRWRNMPEVNTVAEVLRRLQAIGDDRPEIAVLTPYRAQHRFLEDRIAADRRSGRLDNLERFSEVGGGICHTVDSFQGNEADVVVISLVRNNAHSGVKSLGFLSDKRRMNVLMSRARWRLVLVGSLDFLKARFQEELEPEEGERLGFLRRWLAAFQELEGTKGPDGVPFASVVHIADLLGDGE